MGDCNVKWYTGSVPEVYVLPFCEGILLQLKTLQVMRLSTESHLRCSSNGYMAQEETNWTERVQPKGSVGA